MKEPDQKIYAPGIFRNCLIFTQKDWAVADTHTHTNGIKTLQIPKKQEWKLLARSAQFSKATIRFTNTIVKFV